MRSWNGWKGRLCGALLLGAASMQGAVAVPLVQITATPDPAIVGSSVTLNVAISGVTDLYGYQFSLAFNPAVLRATSITEGAFLGTGGATFFDGGTIDNTLGLISFSYDSLISAVPGVSGGGVLERIAFNVLAAGTSSLTFSDALFLSSALSTIDVTLQNRQLNAISVVGAVPEPETYALIGAGLAALTLVRRRRSTARPQA